MLHVDQLSWSYIATIQSEAEQDLVSSTFTNLPRHVPWVFHLQVKALDPILCRNLELKVHIVYVEIEKI